MTDAHSYGNLQVKPGDSVTICRPRKGGKRGHSLHGIVRSATEETSDQPHPSSSRKRTSDSQDGSGTCKKKKKKNTNIRMSIKTVYHRYSTGVSIWNTELIQSTFLLHDKTKSCVLTFHLPLLQLVKGLQVIIVQLKTPYFKRTGQQARNCLLHHQTVSTGGTKPPEMSGGRPPSCVRVLKQLSETCSLVKQMVVLCQLLKWLYRHAAPWDEWCVNTSNS